jgi:hypothetical protein
MASSGWLAEESAGSRLKIHEWLNLASLYEYRNKEAAVANMAHN